MLQSIDKIRFLTGNREMLTKIPVIPARATWNERTVDFLGAFSRNLLKDPRTRGYADVTTYAFWIRNASLRQTKEKNYPHVEDKVGRGMAFHIAPSNVPINFAVSFTSSLLAGNVNVVRISDKVFEQVDIISDSLKKTFSDGFEDMEQYLIIVRYEHDDEITRYISSMCDVRIVWGGDQTIDLIRGTKLPPRAIEMTFSDRHSIALIDSDAVIDTDVEKLAREFYIDTYYMDQNACSSPRMVIWFGNHLEEAKKKFWDEIYRLVKEDYDFREIQAIDKLDSFCRLAAVNTNIELINHNNRVVRVRIDNLCEDIMDYKEAGGYFFEYDAKELSEIAPVLDKSCQTIAYYGIDGCEIQRFVIDGGFRGVDRIVPIGKTMDLTFKWDGFDMIETMSRYVYCPDYNMSL